MATEPQAPQEAQEPQSIEVMRLRQERALAEFGGGPFSSNAATSHYLKVAELFSQSAFVPEIFRGRPADCLIALDLARSMDEPPLRVMQNLYVVSGRPAFYAQFMIARANRLAGYQSSIHWRTENLSPPMLGKHPNLKVTAYASDRYGEEISVAVDMAMAQAEGWTKNPKYASMPEHMLRWRAAAFLIRLYNPEVMNGFPTAEEAQDVAFAARTQEALAPGESKVDRLVERLLAPQKAAEAAEEEPQADAPDDVPELAREAPALEGDHPDTLLSPKMIHELLKEATAHGLSQAQLEVLIEDVTGSDPTDVSEDPLGWDITLAQAEQIAALMREQAPAEGEV